MTDIAKIALLLAVVASVYSALAFFFGVRRSYPPLLASARNGVFATMGLVTLASLILLYALVTHHFEIAYVASYTSRDMSLPYLAGAFWAGNAGSLLLWTWLLSIFAVLLLLLSRNKSQSLVAYSSVVVMATLTFFLILMYVVANPFDELGFTPADGTGLNPLLENPGMLLHPPALLGGYVACTIPFALALGALATMAPQGEWLASARRWALTAWLLLGIGNLIGMWWAYVELGWGGYWAWDPVENAGLMPWLAATALLHALAMQRARQIFRIWVVVLVILAFELCIFGTFLTRSNILSSVHTFNESGMEPFFLTFIGISLIAAVGLLLYRRKSLVSEKEGESLLSKEASFTLTNLILVGGTFVVLLGTIFPLLREWVTGDSTGLDRSFYDKVMGPIFLVLLFVLAICVFLRWRRTDGGTILRRGVLPLSVALVLGLILFALGIREWYALVLFPLFAFAAFSILSVWAREVMARRRVRNENPVRAFAGSLLANRPRYGGMVVHLGILLLAVGIVGSSFYQAETESALAAGESMTIEGYTLTYEGVQVDQGTSKTILTATLSVRHGNKDLGSLRPQKIAHRNYDQLVTEVAIRSTPVEDLYVILAGWNEGATLVTFQVLVNPLVLWIWVGGALVVLGGLIAFWPRRRIS